MKLTYKITKKDIEQGGTTTADCSIAKVLRENTNKNWFVTAFVLGYRNSYDDKLWLKISEDLSKWIKNYDLQKNLNDLDKISPIEIRIDEYLLTADLV